MIKISKLFCLSKPYRAMAMSILLLFGRLGGIAGANVTALLLENQCETVFYLFGSSIMGRKSLSFFNT